MTPELTVLALAALLQVGQIILMAVPANLEVGIRKTLSPRDRARLGGSLEEHLSLRTGRLKRAMDNHFEGLILFTIAVVIVTLGQQSTLLTTTCAWVYLGARVLYVPAYAFGLSPWRSLIWAVGLLATVIMVLAALF